MGTIYEGDYLVAVRCPHCDRRVGIPATIEVILKTKNTEAKLSVACTAKAVPHNCAGGDA